MKQTLLFFCVLFLLWGSMPVVMGQTPRKKVAVVLSGGGAKGTAHVRALKVIEEAGIPIDMVVGTSMGSIIGGLYAMGYTTQQLDSLIRAQDWMALLTDAVPRSRENLSKKLTTDRYVLSVPFQKKPSEVLQGGLLKGRAIGKLFTDLTIGLHDSIDFHQLKIPFACVAVDITNGKEVDFRSGILAECMRASMSIPGVFAPVRKNGMILVDGGLANNYPADLAQDMGADIIIGVDVSGEAKKADELNSMGDVLAQIISFACENKYDQNIKLTDLLIKVDVNGYSAASFSSVAIDTLMSRGEAAARDKWQELLALKQKIGLTEPIAKRTPLVIHTDSVVKPIPSIYPKIQNGSLLNLGARFDTEELATIMVGASYQLKKSNDSRIAFEARLGKRSYAQLQYSIHAFSKWHFAGSYQLEYDDIRMYNAGKHIGDVSYTLNQLDANLSRSWREVKLTFGAHWSAYHFSDLLLQNDWSSHAAVAKENETGLAYYANMQFDNQDARVYPTRGMKWNLRYNYFTDNGYGYNGRAGLHILEGFWEFALPMNSKLTLLPAFRGRILPERNEYVSNLNFIGGVQTYGHYLPQQLPFAGVNYVEFTTNDLFILGATLRQRIATNNYVFGIANYALMGSDLEGLITEKKCFGAALGYGYNTPVGPIEANFNWSNLTKKVTFYFSVGYMF